MFGPSLKGEFSEAKMWVDPLHPNIKFREISFKLTNTAWRSNETLDYVVCDCYGQHPLFMTGQTLPAGQSFIINRPNTNASFYWCQYDFFAVFKNRKLVDVWVCNKNIYRPGECPDCKGTTICKFCGGDSLGTRLIGLTSDFSMHECPNCDSGTCGTCAIRYRKPDKGVSPFLTATSPYFNVANSLLQQIAMVDNEIEQCDWNIQRSVPSPSRYSVNANIQTKMNRARSPFMLNRYKLELQKQKLHYELIKKALLPAIAQYLQ